VDDLLAYKHNLVVGQRCREACSKVRCVHDCFGCRARSH